MIPLQFSRRRVWVSAATVALRGSRWRYDVAGAAEQAGLVTAATGVAVAEAEPPRPLHPDGPVFLNEMVRTGDASRLTLRLGAATTVRLGARARLRVDRFVANAGGELSFESGQFLLDSPPHTFANGLSVRSPYALIAVRGTRVWGGTLDDAFAVFVEQGSVLVAAGGSWLTLGPGEGTTIPRPGAQPEPAHSWGAAKIGRAMALVN
jgi:ferric-dicitrate binding protein FerR (iron transport regulator)